jgi:hypothetical protein
MWKFVADAVSVGAGVLSALLQWAKNWIEANGWMKLFAVVCLLVGLGLTTWGAFTASSAVIISREQAKHIAETNWGANQQLEDSLVAQSKQAKKGLQRVMCGTVLQFIGTLLSLSMKSRPVLRGWSWKGS